jgi:spermidine/putrescine-binding protein
MKNLKIISIIVVFISATTLLQFCSNSEKNDEKNKISDKLNIYNWDGLFAPNTISEFEAQNKLKITYDLYASNEEAMT